MDKSYRTVIKRDKLSKPVRILMDRGFINPSMKGFQSLIMVVEEGVMLHY